ncbi:serine protease inhibitor 33 precursor [Bombyx mori]|uniref:Serpin-33 n=1 Tax=Bombyx mori TaxID=7091 RepID=B6DZ41_BOMMO|nr:serine protease inhibitor 33 precursor [Bombyx mori]ACI24664.1 serpin-33 [Bombyx mori]
MVLILVFILSLDFVYCQQRFTVTNYLESRLALDALKQSKNENMIVSTLPVRFSLCKLASVAKDDAKTELLSALGYKSDFMIKTCYTGIKEVLDFLKWSDLLMFNKIYVNYTDDIETKFIANSSSVYGVQVDRVGFNTPSSAISFINRWIEKATYNRIREILDHGDINQSTRMILISVAHFKATWEFPFDVRMTADKIFHYQNKSTTKTPMMMKHNEFLYYDDKLNNLRVGGRAHSPPDVKWLLEPIDIHNVLSITLGSFGTSITYIMPDDQKGLPGLLEKLAKESNFVKNIKKMMTRTRMRIGLPRMKIKTTIDWIKPLRQLGVNQIFNETTSNFESILKSNSIIKNMFVNKVKQKLFLELDEMGVSRHRSPLDPEMMSQDRVMLGPGINVLEFILDRPFYFMVTLSLENVQHDLFNGVFYGP